MMIFNKEKWYYSKNGLFECLYKGNPATKTKGYSFITGGYVKNGYISFTVETHEIVRLATKEDFERIPKVDLLRLIEGEV